MFQGKLCLQLCFSCSTICNAVMGKDVTYFVPIFDLILLVFTSVFLEVFYFYHCFIPFLMVIFSSLSCDSSPILHLTQYFSLLLPSQIIIHSLQKSFILIIFFNKYKLAISFFVMSLPTTSSQAHILATLILRECFPS